MKKLFPEDPVFKTGSVGFDDKDASGQKLDVLDRKPLGQKLTDLVDRINQPLVIALDGGWGSGKSHFLKLWTGAHSKELGGKAEVIYFDAFEHDFLDDPLVSLISRLTVESEEKSWDVKAIAAVKRSIIPLIRTVARVGFAVGTAGAIEAANALGDAAIGKLADVTDASIDQFWKTEANRIAAMQGFRQALTDLTTPKNDAEKTRKIVFIVDELDRCRPDYALSMLEIIKHFFAVPNVHFVLGVNLGSLENSVRKRYGAQFLDASTYLQKFIHLRMSFPKFLDPHENTSATINYLQEALSEAGLDNQTLDEVIEQANFLNRTHSFSLRDVDRIRLELALVMPSSKLAAGYRAVLVSLLLMKVLAPKTYGQFMAGKADLNEIESFLGKPNEDSHTANWLWNFWRATYGIDVEGKSYAEYLRDCRAADRRGYVRRFFSARLETFGLA